MHKLRLRTSLRKLTWYLLCIFTATSSYFCVSNANERSSVDDSATQDLESQVSIFTYERFLTCLNSPGGITKLFEDQRLGSSSYVARLEKKAKALGLAMAVMRHGLAYLVVNNANKVSIDRLLRQSNFKDTLKPILDSDDERWALINKKRIPEKKLCTLEQALEELTVGTREYNRKKKEITEREAEVAPITAAINSRTAAVTKAHKKVRQAYLRVSEVIPNAMAALLRVMNAYVTASDRAERVLATDESMEDAEMEMPDAYNELSTNLDRLKCEFITPCSTKVVDPLIAASRIVQTAKTSESAELRTPKTRGRSSTMSAPARGSSLPAASRPATQFTLQDYESAFYLVEKNKGLCQYLAMLVVITKLVGIAVKRVEKVIAFTSPINPRYLQQSTQAVAVDPNRQARASKVASFTVLAKAKGTCVDLLNLADLGRRVRQLDLAERSRRRQSRDRLLSSIQSRDRLAESDDAMNSPNSYPEAADGGIPARNADSRASTTSSGSAYAAGAAVAPPAARAAAKPLPPRGAPLPPRVDQEEAVAPTGFPWRIVTAIGCIFVTTSLGVLTLFSVVVMQSNRLRVKQQKAWYTRLLTPRG